MVSVGDKIEVAVRGQENAVYEVNSEGQLVTDLFTASHGHGKDAGRSKHYRTKRQHFITSA